MIPFDFEYLRPESVQEACESYTVLQKDGIQVMYYAGGTEIVTFCRTHKIQPGALIDLKHIPECRELGKTDGELVFGAALSLNEIIEDDSFPLLSQVAKTIADHSVRNRLTLGGNLAGRLPYRETALPYLLAETVAYIAGPTGERQVPFSELCQTRLLLEEGGFVVQIRVPKMLSIVPARYQRKTVNSRVDYPIASAAYLRDM